MKVLHFFYAGLGGHQSVFTAHEKLAKKNGIEHSVCLYGIEDPMESTISFLKERNIPFHFVKKKQGLDLGFYSKVVKAIHDLGPDLVFLHSAQIVPFLKFSNLFKKNLKIVVRETQALTLKSKFQKLSSSFALKFADKMVFLSEDYRNQFLSNQSKKYFGKTTVIPNGLDTDYFKPKNQKDKLNVAPFTFGMIARMVDIKDHYTLIDALKNLLDKGINAQLEIAGDGATFEKVKQYSIDKGVQRNTKMLGLINGTEIVEFFHRLDVYVHSSLGETMSNSIMQAQACGLPIVATNVFGINNVITDEENGYLFELGDNHKLTQLLEKLMTNPGERQRLSTVSRQYALDNLDDKVMFEKYLQLYQSIK